MSINPQIITINQEIESAQFGITVCGEAVANQPFNFGFSFQYANAIGWRSAMVGHGRIAERLESKGNEYELKKRRDPSQVKFASLSLLSATGAIIGRIRSDVQKTIITSLEFTIVNGDCRDFVLELNKLPDFPLAPFAVIQINIGDSDFNWFIGKVTDQEGLGAKNGKTFVFKGEGLRITDLENLVFDDTNNFPAGLDVGEIVDTIVREQIQGQCFVKYNSAKIQTNTGVLTANVLQPGKSKLPKFIDTLAKMGNCDWGVDGEGDFFFLPKVTDTVRTFHVGYEVNDFVPRLNLQDVKNTIFMQRQNGKGSGGAGWAVSGIFSDETSIAKYGKRELRFQAPGFFSDFDLQTLGNRLLSDLKEPKFSAQVTGFQVFTELDYILRGIHRFILPFDRYRQVWDEIESKDDWTGDYSGLVISDSTDAFVFGASSVKVQANASLGSYIQKTLLFANYGKLKKIYIWVRSSKEGAVLKAGLGLGAWNQYTNTIVFPQKDVFFAFEWNISNLNLRKIDTVGFEISTNDSFDFYIDRIEFEVAGFPYYKMASSKQTYKFSPNNSNVNLEFDKIPSKMEDYINNILALAEENRFVAEVR